MYDFLLHGLFHCNRHHCSICKHSSKNSSFHSNHINKTFNIHGHISCNSTNLIYIITCSKCQKQYVGKTGRKLKTRLTEHFRNICQHTNIIIGLHFNTTGHTIEHMQVNTIEKLHKSSNYRKAKELFWINKLQTLKHDLNKKKTLLSIVF